MTDLQTFDLATLRRSLDFLDDTGITDHGELDMRRIYLGIANGTAAATPGMLAVLEEAAGGALAVGTIPAHSDGRRLVNVNDLHWCRQYADLREFVMVHGRTPNQHAKDVAERQLGQWLSTQRQRYGGAVKGKASLAEGQRTQLEQVSGFFVKSAAEAWQENLDQLREFISAHGRTPSKCSKDVAERQLGQWLAVQRQKYKGTAKAGAPLTSEQRAQLEQVPGFLVRSAEMTWQENLDSVHGFISAHGRMPSKCSKDVAERKLGVWLSTQREKHKDVVKRKASLTEMQRTQLEQVPGFFMKTAAEVWQENLNQMREFIAVHGRTPSGKAEDATERKLGVWLSRQRQRYTDSAKKKAPLTEDQRVQLLSIPGFITPAVQQFINTAH